MVRAKFRCLELTYYLTDARAKLKPVIAKNKDWPAGSEENAAFWQASPSGECEVRFRTHGEVDLEVGAYYYIDMERSDSGGWKLFEVSRSETSLGVKLGLGWDSSRPVVSSNLHIDIQNEGAWPPFLEAVGSLWSVTFTKAEGAPSGCPYTG